MVSRFKVGSVIFTYCNVVVLVALIAFPITAEAFSRRADSSEVGPHQAQASRDGQTDMPQVSPPAVAEPPALLLLGRPRSIRHLLPDQAIPWARCVPRERQVNSPGA